MRKPFGGSVAVHDLVDRFLFSGGLLAGAEGTVAVPVAHVTFAVHGKAEAEPGNRTRALAGGDGRLTDGLATSFFLASGQEHEEAKSEQLFHLEISAKGSGSSKSLEGNADGELVVETRVVRFHRRFRCFAAFVGVFALEREHAMGLIGGESRPHVEQVPVRGRAIGRACRGNDQCPDPDQAGCNSRSRFHTLLQFRSFRATYIIVHYCV
ncbi:MAG: hypothetical protein RLZZ360_788 [Candidatus Parcubacteria bacterium]